MTETPQVGVLNFSFLDGRKLELNYRPKQTVREFMLDNRDAFPSTMQKPNGTPIVSQTTFDYLFLSSGVLINSTANRNTVMRDCVESGDTVYCSFAALSLRRLELVNNLIA